MTLLTNVFIFVIGYLQYTECVIPVVLWHGMGKFVVITFYSSSQCEVFKKVKLLVHWNIIIIEFWVMLHLFVFIGLD